MSNVESCERNLPPVNGTIDFLLCLVLAVPKDPVGDLVPRVRLQFPPGPSMPFQTKPILPVCQLTFLLLLGLVNKGNPFCSRKTGERGQEDPARIIGLEWDPQRKISMHS